MLLAAATSVFVAAGVEVKAAHQVAEALVEADAPAASDRTAPHRDQRDRGDRY